MKKKYLAAFILILLLINAGCTNYDNMYPEKFYKILYLKNSGVIDMKLFKTGENTEYSVTVVKAGTDPTAIADAKFTPMDQKTLDIYCASRGLSYQALPENCYTLDATDLSFTATELYKKIGLSLKTSEIESAVQKDVETDYVIPFMLTSVNDSINSTMNVLIIKPVVVVPSIAFETVGYVSNISPKEGKTIDIPLTLQITNNWDFDCLVEVDETALAGTQYNLLPKGTYELVNGGKVSFKKGSSKATLQVKVNALQHADNTLPLRIKSVSKETFTVDKTPVLMGVTIEKYPLTVAMLTSNATEPTEGSLANLLDNDVTSYFHTAWSIAVTGDHYVQVSLPQGISSFKFSYTNRSVNGNAALADFELQGSEDNKNFTLLKHFISDVDKLPGGGAGVYNSPLLETKSATKYLRFVCKKNFTGGKYFVWSEFSLYGF